MRARQAVRHGGGLRRRRDREVEAGRQRQVDTGGEKLSSSSCGVLRCQPLHGVVVDHFSVFSDHFLLRKEEIRIVEL